MPKATRTGSSVAIRANVMDQLRAYLADGGPATAAAVCEWATRNHVPCPDDQGTPVAGRWSPTTAQRLLDRALAGDELVVTHQLMGDD